MQQISLIEGSLVASLFHDSVMASQGFKARFHAKRLSAGFKKGVSKTAEQSLK
jgi:hypothetical protein